MVCDHDLVATGTVAVYYLGENENNVNTVTTNWKGWVRDYKGRRQGKHATNLKQGLEFQMMVVFSTKVIVKETVFQIVLLLYVISVISMVTLKTHRTDIPSVE